MNSSLVRKLIYPIHEKVMGRDTFVCLDELEQLQWASAGELEELGGIPNY